MTMLVSDFSEPTDKNPTVETAGHSLQKTQPSHGNVPDFFQIKSLFSFG